MHIHQPRTRKTAMALAVTLTLGVAPAQDSLAAACAFNPATGNWGVAGNWSCGIVPTGGPDSATVGSGKAVTVNTAQSVLNLSNSGSVNIDAFLLSLGGGGSTVNTGTINVGAGPIPNNAALQVAAGHTITNAGGLINISADSVLNQFGSTITGGSINTTGTGKVVMFNNGANYLRGVTLNGTIDTATQSGLVRLADGFTLNGSVGIGNSGYVNLEGTQAIGGNGSFVFGASGNNRLGVDGGGITATLGANTVVRGHTGTVGVGSLVNGSGNTLLNLGTISADSGGTIAIAGATLANQSVVEATGAGSVLRLDTSVTNNGGTLRSSAGGVLLQNGVTVSGGTIGNSGGGVYRATNNGNNLLAGTTVAGGSVVDLASAASLLRVQGGLTLNGTVNVNNASLINFEGNQTLAGSGSIVFGSTASSNRVGVDGGNKTLTVASGVTIRGENGVIGLGQLINGSGNALVNNGTISADVAGGTITLAGLGAGVTNNGTIRAFNGGTIALQSDLAGGSGSQLVAGAGSVISQQGVTISGVINTSGSGHLRPTNNGGNYLSGVILNGSLDMTPATATERVTNNLVLNGSIGIDSASVLNFEGTQTLSGNGTIVLGAAGAGNRVGVDGGNKTLTIASGITIRGQNGTIGLGQLVNGSGNALINHGTLSADVAGGVVTLAGLGAGITNNGIISALNGGTLQLQSDLIGSPAGQLMAGAGSVISQQGVTISGVINTSGSGNLRATNNGGNYLSGVTLNGHLDLAAGTSLERVVNNLVLNGTVNVNSASRINFEGNQTLSGNGSIVFGGTAANNIVGVDGGNKTLTIANGVTIRGQNGTIGLGQLVNGSGNTLLNQGLISSDSGGTINTAGATLANQGIAQATGIGSVLRLDSTVNNTGGTLRSSNGGVVLQNGVTVTGGTIGNTAGGTYRLTNSGGNYLSGVALNSGSTIDMATAASLGRVVNGMTVNGTVNIDNGSLLNMEGDQTLSGSGAIVFGAAATGNRIGIDGGGKTLTIASGVTIRGATGSIGLGQLINGSGNSLVNNGTIQSDGAGTIVVQALGGGLTNNGLLRAQAGSLNVQTALAGTGALQVDATGAMALSAGAKSQGVLAMGASGAALDLSTGNLTLSGDYTNGAWGSGNSFNRRAGITGAGQIVAAADAAPRITGSSVTGGTTTNATLTIGNVRVGANHFDYTVGNSGSTGPALRGALQTSVNGASLTDARLSGTGVTAGNYNAGGPAGSGESRTVTFTAASAGALAPLTGQVLNLRSNFENIADQKLNIVLGSGAAAYNAAVGSTITPVQVANQRVGGTTNATLAISNAAAPGAFSEDLHASIASLGGQASASGSVNGRLAGTGNTGSGTITVGVDSASAGSKTGVVNLNYQSMGTVNGVSNGLGAIGVGGQTVTVSGNVYQPAAGQILSAPLNFGTVQVGQTVSHDLQIRNTASGPAGFVEDLNASFGAKSGTGTSLFSGTGSLSGITAGSTSGAGNGTMTVSVNTTAAGSISGSIAVNYTSAGAVGGVSNGLGTLAVGSENFGVAGTIQAQANVINQASPVLNTPALNLGAVRVGAAAPTALVSLTNQDVGSPQAALNAGITSNGAPVGASGSFNGLLPGASSTALQVSLNTATAGNFTGSNAGSATITLVSDAGNVGNCAPNCQLSLAPQTVTVSGKVYTPAVGQSNTPVVDFGIVRVGDTVSARNITVSNAAVVSALNDTLRASLAGVTGPFAPGAAADGVAAGTSGQISVGLNTGAAGVFNQGGSVAFVSRNADMADVSAGPDAGVQVKAQVNHLANADFDLLAGLGQLSDLGNGTFVLNLGQLALGSNGHWLLQLDNEVSGPADALRGSFDLGAVDDFALGGFGAVGDLDAGRAQGGLEVDFHATRLGSFEDEVSFRGFSVNASDPDGVAQGRRLLIRATVFDPNSGGGTVPEPGTLALLLLAALAAVRAKGRAPRH